MIRTAADAIARSVSHNEIVTLDYDSTLAVELLEESDDCVHGASTCATETPRPRATCSERGR